MAGCSQRVQPPRVRRARHFAANGIYLERNYRPAMKRYFSTNMPFWRFARNSLAISCAGMAPLLLLYIVLTPGFTAMLFRSGPAMVLFLRQVATNGLPVVFIVNFLSFFIYAVHMDKYGAEHIPTHLNLLDLPMRILLFVALHGLIYVLSAEWFGSFGGGRLQALGVVAPTLVRSAFFENLSGVYFYAIVLSALPLHIPAIERTLAKSQGHHSFLRRLLPAKPCRLVERIMIALVISAILTILLIGLSASIVVLQTV